MAPRRLWCAALCAAAAAGTPAESDPGGFVVVQGLWLPPAVAAADAAPRSADALPVHSFHGLNAGAGLGWLRSATHNRLYAERLGGRYQLYLFQGPKLTRTVNGTGHTSPSRFCATSS